MIPTDTPVPQPPPRRRLLGCLIKGPLGCASFLIGAVVILILFLPSACGRMARKDLEELFNEHFEGELTVGHTWLFSLYGPQWVNGIKLRDPQGAVVLEGELDAPDLWSLFSDGYADDPEPWGPVEVTVTRLHLREGADGITNLERALTARQPGTDFPLDLAASNRSIELRHEGEGLVITNRGGVSVRVQIDQFTYETPATKLRGRKIILEDIELDGVFGVENRQRYLRLAGLGYLPSDTEDETRRAVHVGYRIDRFESLGKPDGSTWELKVGAESVAAEDLEILFGLEGRLVSAFGARLDEARIVLKRDEIDRLLVEELKLSSESGTLTLLGGHLGADGRLVALDDRKLSVDFPVDSWWTREALRPLLPLCTAIVSDDPAARGRFELDHFVLPRNSFLEGISGEARIDLPPSAWRLPETLVAKFPNPARKPLGGKRVSLASLIEGGVVHFDKQQLFSMNARITYDGDYDLRSGELKLIVGWPMSWPAVPGTESGETETNVIGTLVEMGVSPVINR